jgi:hypothetical protein
VRNTKLDHSTIPIFLLNSTRLAHMEFNNIAKQVTHYNKTICR